MMKSKYLFFTSLLILLLAGCTTPPASTATSVIERGGGSVTGSTLNETRDGSYTVFMVKVENPGDPVGIDFRGTVAAGSLQVQLLDPTGSIAWEQPASGGSFAINQVVRPDAAGEYQLGLAWDGSAQAQYSLMWQPGEIQQPVVTAVALIQGAGMVLVALAFLLYAAIRHLGFRYLALGALAWVVTVAVKFAIAIPLNPVVLDGLAGSGLPDFVFGPMGWIYIGVLTGITEILITYLVLRYTRLGKVAWGWVLAFGIGFGAVEALLLGFGPLISVLVAILAPTSLPPDALVSLTLLNDPLYGFAGVWERFFTILIHLFSNVLIFYAVLRREPKWFWLAFVYKSGLDAVAGYAQLSGNLSALGFIWIIEAFVAVMGILGWVGTRWIGKRYREVWEAATPVEGPVDEIMGIGA